MFSGHYHTMSALEHVVKVGQPTQLVFSSTVSQGLHITVYNMLCYSRYLLYVCARAALHHGRGSTEMPLVLGAAAG